MKSQHREILFNIYNTVGSGKFTHSFVNERHPFHQTHLKTMSEAGYVEDLGRIIPSISTRMWRIHPHLIPDIEEHFSYCVLPSEEVEKTIAGFRLKRNEQLRVAKAKRAVTA